MMQKGGNLEPLLAKKNTDSKQAVMFPLLYLSLDERTCLSVEVRVSQGNVENFKHFTAKKESGYFRVCFIETLHCTFPWQSQKLVNYILLEIEITEILRENFFSSVSAIW